MNLEKFDFLTTAGMKIAVLETWGDLDGRKWTDVSEDTAASINGADKHTACGAGEGYKNLWNVRTLLLNIWYYILVDSNLQKQINLSDIHAMKCLLLQICNMFIFKYIS